MSEPKKNLEEIIKKVNDTRKARQVFVTNKAGTDVNWDMVFQFNLDDQKPFYLQIEDTKGELYEGKAENPDIIMSGDSEAIVKICNGQGDFTHAISREEITVEQGKVMEVIRLTRAITAALKSQ
ncbi:MAG: SCP2 sterol-binding domain-containing protein [Promethearchaeia archaeon]